MPEGRRTTIGGLSHTIPSLTALVTTRTTYALISRPPERIRYISFLHTCASIPEVSVAPLVGAFISPPAHVPKQRIPLPESTSVPGSLHPTTPVILSKVDGFAVYPVLLIDGVEDESDLGSRYISIRRHLLFQIGDMN
jgi:hypothetical protein